MQFPGHPQLGHLTYCTNIHAGADWPDMIAGLRAWVPSIKASVSPNDRFGLGLRIAASAAETLRTDEAFNELQTFLAETNGYVFTINGFPYGPFHGEPVKEQVYAPDWRTPERLAYTNTLADLLVKILPDGIDGSISTVPGSFKAWSHGNEAAIADGLLRHVAHLIDLKRASGRTIRLALEPEPCCMLETIAETVAFFETFLFSHTATATVAQATGTTTAEAEAAIRNHLGVCYDVCHAAVEYEDPKQSVADLKSAGIRIPKLQLSSALRIATVDAATSAALAPFNEPVYLHQVIARDPRRAGAPLQRFVDLPDALSQADAFEGQEWRVHFHVPIFIPQLEAFDTTQFFLSEILELHRKAPISDHLEVETYTWDVLPDTYRETDVGGAIARELEWVKGKLLA
ncbi:MAG: metabolite traffic protein EboE [Pseudomonadota bacterium]